MANDQSDFQLEGPPSAKGPFSWFSDINSEQWKSFIAAFLGWTLDAMDLLLFAFAVGSIAEVFNLSPEKIGALFSVTLFASAFGGALFGVVSDYFGRVRALTYTILLYSFFTGLSAFSPNVIFFLVCRVFLGLGMGGEWASGEVLVAESWPKQHRGKVIGMVQSGWAIGYILAALLATAILPYFDVDLGWRILFLIGVTPAFLVLYIRRNLSEPEIWRKTSLMRKEKKLAGDQDFTFIQVFKHGLLGYTLLSMLLTSLCMISYWGLMFWVPQFLARPISEGGVGLGTKGFIWIIPLNIGAFLGCLTFGWISDRLGRRPVFISYLLVMAILVYFFGQAQSLSQVLLLGPLVGFFGTGFYSGFGAIFSEMFPTRARGAAMGLCYNFGRGVSAIAPPLVGFVAGMKGYGTALISVSIFAVAAALVVLALPETRGKDLEI